MKKFSKNKLKELQKDWREHNKTMKRKHLHSMVFKDFGDYVEYRFGKKTKSTFKEYVPPKDVRTRQKVYSLTEMGKLPSANITNKPGEKLNYSGSYIVGIATMHKSNAVPVSKDDDPEIFAKMRRN